MLDGVLDKKTLREARKRYTAALVKLGLDPSVTIRLRESLGSDHWIAQYRGRSQFGVRPIFWVSVRHPDDVEELTRSLLHEYGHVIAEWVRYREPALWEDLDGVYPDEEEFAEDFADHATGRARSWVGTFVQRVIDSLPVG